MLHISCNVGTRDLPDMYSLSPWDCGPWALGIHIRQITSAHVTVVICNMGMSDLPDMQHFAWADQMLVQGNISYTAWEGGQYPDNVQEYGFQLSFDPPFDPTFYL